jgi:hypothetical protein
MPSRRVPFSMEATTKACRQVFVPAWVPARPSANDQISCRSCVTDAVERLRKVRNLCMANMQGCHQSYTTVSSEHQQCPRQTHPERPSGTLSGRAASTPTSWWAADGLGLITRQRGQLVADRADVIDKPTPLSCPSHSQGQGSSCRRRAMAWRRIEREVLHMSI